MATGIREIEILNQVEQTLVALVLLTIQCYYIVHTGPITSLHLQIVMCHDDFQSDSSPCSCTGFGYTRSVTSTWCLPVKLT